jgi:thiamine-phosphate pyrophosphorylase
MSSTHFLADGPPYSRSHRLCGLYVITQEQSTSRSVQNAGANFTRDNPTGDNLAREDSVGENSAQQSRHVRIARAALNGGARVIQLRDKSSSLAQLLPIGHELRRLTLRHDALLIINDRVDIALACDADGVHLGPDDMPPDAARRLLGPHRIIGVSCGDEEEAQHAATRGADYIGAGAIFVTLTKTDAGAPIGLHRLRAIVDATSLPVAAIGGVDISNIASTREAGAVMSCVVSAVSAAGEEAAMTEAARALVEAAKFGRHPQ